MSRKPSAETQLRQARSDMRALRSHVTSLNERCDLFRARAAKAEQQCSQWRERFYRLLKRDLSGEETL